MTAIKTIDAHVGGGAVRLIVDGFPAPRGRTMAEKRQWAARHADQVRRAVLFEPRGHAGLIGAVLTEAVSAGSHAGVLFMNGQGFASLSGHGVIAVVTIALERQLIVPGGNGYEVILDTPAGTVRASAVYAEAGAGEDRLRVRQVSYTGVPSFVAGAGIDVPLAHRRVRADLAFSGAFYAIVDGEALGVALDAAHIADMRRVGSEVRRVIEASRDVQSEPKIEALHGTILTGPSMTGAADLRSVTVFANAQVARSASGTGTAALMAVLDAMGLLEQGTPFVNEGLIGTTLSGRIASRTEVGGVPAIVPEVSGAAWIVGEQTFLLDPEDPLRSGFEV